MSRVVKDHNSKTAIVIKEGRKFIHFIPMKAGKLTVKKLPIVRFGQTYTDSDIDLTHAVKLYIKHSGGLTDTVSEELNNILGALC